VWTHVCIRVLFCFRVLLCLAYCFVSCGWSVICCQEWGFTLLLVGKLGHTGLVPFGDELGTVCGEDPLDLQYSCEANNNASDFSCITALFSVRPPVFKHKNIRER